MHNIFEANQYPELPDEPVFSRGCFGKAEFQNDFIHFGLKDKDMMEFKRQLRGLGALSAKAYQTDNERVYRHIPDTQFILMNPVEVTTCAGVISPRVDMSGRSFPLVIFNSISNCRLKRQTAAVPVLLQEFFEQASELMLKDLKNMNLEGLESAVAGFSGISSDLTRSRLFDAVMDLLKGTDVREFWQRLPIEDDPAERARFITTIMVLLNIVIKQSPGKIPWGIRLPLPDTEFVLPYVVLYIQLVESRLKECSWQAQVFWNRANDQLAASLTIFFRPVKSVMLHQLFDPQHSKELIVDVLDEMKRYDKPTEQAFIITGNDKDSLMDALFKWAGFESP